MADSGSGSRWDAGDPDSRIRDPDARPHFPSDWGPIDRRRPGRRKGLGSRKLESAPDPSALPENAIVLGPPIITPAKMSLTRERTSRRVSPASGMDLSRMGPESMTTESTEHTEKTRGSGLHSPTS